MDELLLDTTYLLPLFGVDIGLQNFGLVFPNLLRSRRVRFNPVSLVEAKWIILRIARANPSVKGQLFKAYRTGLSAILSGEELESTELTNDRIEEIADNLQEQGMKDYFDRLIYATAAYLGLPLLTEDELIHALAQRRDLRRPREALRWRDVAKDLKRPRKT